MSLWCFYKEMYKEIRCLHLLYILTQGQPIFFGFLLVNDSRRVTNQCPGLLAGLPDCREKTQIVPKSGKNYPGWII